jgi:hypothetical protein
MHVLSEMKARKLLVTRKDPLDKYGPHVLLYGAAVLEAVAAEILNELLGARKIIEIQPCRPTYARCYGLVSSRPLQATVAVKKNEGAIPSRTANLNPRRKPHGQI